MTEIISQKVLLPVPHNGEVFLKPATPDDFIRMTIHTVGGRTLPEFVAPKEQGWFCWICKGTHHATTLKVWGRLGSRRGICNVCIDEMRSAFYRRGLTFLHFNALQDLLIERMLPDVDIDLLIDLYLYEQHHYSWTGVRCEYCGLPLTSLVWLEPDFRCGRCNFQLVQGKHKTYPLSHSERLDNQSAPGWDELYDFIDRFGLYSHISISEFISKEHFVIQFSSHDSVVSLVFHRFGGCNMTTRSYEYLKPTLPHLLPQPYHYEKITRYFRAHFPQAVQIFTQGIQLEHGLGE